jgi:Sel1 repeat/U-box domain
MSTETKRFLRSAKRKPSSPVSNVDSVDIDDAASVNGGTVDADNNAVHITVSINLSKKAKRIHSVSEPPSSCTSSGSNEDENNPLICPISWCQMKDPVMVFPSGHSFDKESLLGWLLMHPSKDPITRVEQETPLTFADNVNLRKVLVAHHGDDAYVKYDDTEFQFAMGKKYFQGDGVVQSDELAVEWYHRAAEKGHAVAQLELGSMYFFAYGVLQSYTNAAKWYQPAAEQGSAVAQYNLGNMYADGIGVDRDDVKAADFYRQAAEQGYSSAQHNLGVLYHNGHGVNQSYQLAAYWFFCAAAQGGEDAKLSLNKLHQEGKIQTSWAIVTNGR